MDIKRLILAITLSVAIMVGFEFLEAKYFPHPAPTPGSVAAAPDATANSTLAADAAGAPGTAQTAPATPGPRLAIDTPSITGSLALRGAVLDDVQLKAYHVTRDPSSPLVQILGRCDGDKPFYVQLGWTDAGDTHIKTPGNSTVWTASAPTLTPQAPVTLSWDNGAGVTFQEVLSIDDNFMLSVQQKVINKTGAPIQLTPWGQVVREYQPVEQTSYILFDGPLGVLNGTLQHVSYKSVRNDGGKAADHAAYSDTTTGGWIGITDKYWLTALVPDQTTPVLGAVHYVPAAGGATDAYQTEFSDVSPETIAPGATGATIMRVFSGAKIVGILDAYSKQYDIPNFYKAIDFGHLYIITKPIFFALDWLNKKIGNFGLAILVFTVGVKILFFPLANYSYRSMGKMKMVQPKIAAIRERLKDDNTKQQQEIMALYKTEKINPASGCLPMLVQIPVFFALYKVIYITIEMRQAPFYGWIHDLSAPDPTNMFNLFGLIPFNPASLNPLLAVGALPLIMGFTMFLQQRLNPAPPDPVQARMFQFMPIIFTFMLARFPAGLVLYWTWNNLLTVCQQWLIMRRAGARPAKTALVKG